MNILTFDIEDWFHILDNSSTKNESNWNNFESRLYIGIEHIFDLIDKSNLSATFFVLGWIAEKHPKIIKEISEGDLRLVLTPIFINWCMNRIKIIFKDVEKSVKTLKIALAKK